jgi:hypothetical protein
MAKIWQKYGKNMAKIWQQYGNNIATSEMFNILYIS